MTSEPICTRTWARRVRLDWVIWPCRCVYPRLSCSRKCASASVGHLLKSFEKKNWSVAHLTGDFSLDHRFDEAALGLMNVPRRSQSIGLVPSAALNCRLKWLAHAAELSEFHDPRGHVKNRGACARRFFAPPAASSGWMALARKAASNRMPMIAATAALVSAPSLGRWPIMRSNARSNSCASALASTFSNTGCERICSSFGDAIERPSFHANPVKSPTAPASLRHRHADGGSSPTRASRGLRHALPATRSQPRH